MTQILESTDYSQKCLDSNLGFVTSAEALLGLRMYKQRPPPPCVFRREHSRLWWPRPSIRCRNVCISHSSLGAANGKRALSFDMHWLCHPEPLIGLPELWSYRLLVKSTLGFPLFTWANFGTSPNQQESWVLYV